MLWCWCWCSTSSHWAIGANRLPLWQHLWSDPLPRWRHGRCERQSYGRTKSPDRCRDPENRHHRNDRMEREAARAGKICARSLQRGSRPHATAVLQVARTAPPPKAEPARTRTLHRISVGRKSRQGRRKNRTSALCKGKGHRHTSQALTQAPLKGRPHRPLRPCVVANPAAAIGGICCHRDSLVFDKCRVHGDAGHGTDLHALGLIKMPHTFSTLVRVDLVDRGAQINCLVGTLGFTHIAIDALIGNDQSHGISRPLPGPLRTARPPSFDYRRVRLPVTITMPLNGHALARYVLHAMTA